MRSSQMHMDQQQIVEGLAWDLGLGWRGQNPVLGVESCYRT